MVAVSRKSKLASKQLVHVNTCLKALGHTACSPRFIKKRIREYGIQVVGEFPFARGVARMMPKEQMDELLARHTKPAVPVPSESTDRTPEPAKVQPTALEQTIAAQTAEISKLRGDLELVISANNRMAERLDKVLTCLGCS